MHVLVLFSNGCFGLKSMKSTAKCDMHCELQTSVSQWLVERLLCLWDTPEGAPASASVPACACRATVLL